MELAVRRLWLGAVAGMAAVLGGCDDGADALRRLVERGYALSVEELARAAVAGDVEALGWFVEAGVRPDARDAAGLRALDHAVRAGKHDAAAWLWDQAGMGGGIDASLWRAGVASGHPAMVRWLGERSAPPADAGVWLEAVRSGNLDVLELVMDFETASVDAGAALRLASGLGRVDMVAMLLQAGVSVDAADRETGRTALMLAAEAGQVDIVRLLMARGASPQGLSARDPSGRKGGRRTGEPPGPPGDGHP